MLTICVLRLTCQIRAGNEDIFPILVFDRIVRSSDPFQFTMIMDSEFVAIPNSFGGGTQTGPLRDCTGVEFQFITVFNPFDKFGLFSLAGTFLDALGPFQALQTDL